MRLDATYVLPLRWDEDRPAHELTEYLRWLADRMDVIVADGSSIERFQQHADVWGAHVKHVPCDPDLHYKNGKVNGVTTGIRAAGTERVIVADDDIRFDETSLQRTIDLLEDHDLVLTQSFFDPAPWHARWDESRLLLNRALGAHFPVAFGLRRAPFLAAGGYDGDVLFENLEMIRTLTFAGAKVTAPLDLFVRHLPPERSWFWKQRVRQAYDDFTLPARMAVWLGLGPLVLLALKRERIGALGAGVALSIAVAETGRRRGGGKDVYSPVAPLFAPLWLIERAACAWAAVFVRFTRGGVRYRDGVLGVAATPRKELRARIRATVSHHDLEP